MWRKLAISLVIIIGISLPRVTMGFHVDMDPSKGGHDALTREGMSLKKEVHEGDPDGGDKFRTWADEQSLPSFLTGAHDEDSTKTLGGYWGSEKPIGD